jgi:hypothetical protein
VGQGFSPAIGSSKPLKARSTCSRESAHEPIAAANLRSRGHPVITIGLVSLLVVAASGVLFILLTQLWTLEVAFIRVSWIPLVALVLEGVFFGRLISAFSYFAIAIPVFTCIVSLFLTFIGATLLAAARQRHERHVGLLRATIVAAVPGGLLAAYVLYAVLAHAIRYGA